MRILIIQLRRIGDIIVTTPVIDALRRAHPQARIEFLCEGMGVPVLKNYPGLDETLVFQKEKFFHWVKEIRSRRYDMVLDFMNNPRTAQIALLSGAKIRAGFAVPGWGLVYNVRLRPSPVPKYAVQNKFDLLRALNIHPPAEGVLPRLHLVEEDFSGAKSWWETAGLDRFSEKVAIIPAHRRPIRQWPAKRFSELMGLLLEKPGRALILFGGPDEEEFLSSFTKQFSDRVFQIPMGPLRQAASLLSRCDAAVTNDSGLMHLSVASGIPTVTIYGPTWPDCWNPRSAPHRWIQADGLSCLGCNRDVCPYQHECMEWISAERVRIAVEKTLAEI